MNKPLTYIVSEFNTQVIISCLLYVSLPKTLYPSLCSCSFFFLFFFNFSTFQDLQQVMVSGPNLNETSIVSGGYGGTAEGIIPTSSIKGRVLLRSLSLSLVSDISQSLGSTVAPVLTLRR